MLTFETDQIQGAQNIVAKLAVRSEDLVSYRADRMTDVRQFVVQGLPFQTVQHRVSTMDAHPASSTEAAMIVLVTGQLIVRASVESILAAASGTDRSGDRFRFASQRKRRRETRRTRSRSRRRSTSDPRADPTTSTTTSSASCTARCAACLRGKWSRDAGRTQLRRVWFSWKGGPGVFVYFSNVIPVVLVCTVRDELGRLAARDVVGKGFERTRRAHAATLNWLSTAPAATLSLAVC